MRAKRFTAILLLIVTVIGLFPAVSMAAETPDEALGEIHIYNGGEQLAYLAVNGRVQKLNYVYFQYRDKQIPAYCVNPTTDGVPQVVGEGQSVKYLAEEQASDPKIVGIVGNGYPHRSLEELGLDNVQQAYYATKVALWCYLVPGWSIDKVTIAPGLSEHEQQIAERILAATKDIYNRGSGWTDTLIPGLTVTADQDQAYEVQIDGQAYLQQVYTLKSGTWVDGLEVSIWFDSEDVPEGMKIVDMNNQEITKIPIESSGYQGQFKVICPKESAGKSTNVKFLLEGNVNQYAAFYAICQETGTYGQLQNYIADTDPVRTQWTNAMFQYKDNGDDDDGGGDGGGGGGSGKYSLKIIKKETGTGTLLEGAVFEIKDPDGTPVGTYSTNSKGEINITGLEKKGLYTITEKQPPKGHLPAEEPVQQVRVESEDTVATVTYENAPYGNLRVEKVDAETGDTLPGARVQIKHIETGTIYTEVTNEAGAAIFNELKPGAYELMELEAPEGWIKDGQTYTVNVPAQDTVTFTLKNSAKPGLRIIKYDRQTHETLPDITFKIYKDNDLIGTFETDRLGEILLTDLEPGTYRVEEVASDDEHVVDIMPQEIELKAGDGILELVFFNDKKPGLHLVKVDSADPSKVIPNVVFEIEGYGVEFGPEEFTTDENGEIDLSKLEPGTYRVTEKLANGYVIDDAQRIIHLEPGQTGEFVFTNSIKPSLRLVKLSSDGTPLAGVTFRIAKIEDGSHYLDRTTNEAGEILVSDLEPGVYSVKETATTADHIIDLKEYRVELFPGRTSTLTIQNDKRPNLTIHKRDADTGEPVPGTIFEVRAVDGHWVDEVETGPDGTARIENLLPGVYEVTEKSVPEPYLLDADSQLVTLWPNRDADVYFKNHQKPSLEIRKIDSITGDPLKGAKFQIWYASNKTDTGDLRDLGTYYTDENGIIRLEDVEDGWYKVTELEAPDGYAIKDPATQECFIESGGRKVLTFENTPLSAIIIQKVDSETGKPLAGAWFRVRYLGGTSGSGGTIIGEYETSQNGSIVLTRMKQGTYIIEEISAPDGYVIDGTAQTVYLSGKDQDVVTVTFGNKPEGSLLIKKIDSETREPLSDVVFKVTTSDGTVIGNQGGEFTTNSQGTVLISGLEPDSTVIVTEVRTKEGYILDDTPQTAKIKAGETVTLEFRNQPKKEGQLLIRKVCSVNPSVTLPGAEFKITYADGTLVGNSNGIFTTDAHGEIRIDGLEPGKTVIVTETRAPEGYIIDSQSQTVQIKADSVVSLTFQNQPKGELIIQKRDSVTGEALPGAEFRVTTAAGCEVGLDGVIGDSTLTQNGIFTTDENGEIHITNLAPGAYVITEIKAPPGYVIDTPSTNVVIGEGGDTQVVVIKNTPTTSLIIEKYIEGTTTPLKGVTFLVTDGSGAVVGNSNGEFITDENGRIVIDGLEPGTTVIARETKTLEGYVLDTTPKSIRIKAGEAQTLRFYNRAKGCLVIRKLDAETHEPLAGVEFELTYADGGYVDAANGHLSSKGLYTTDKNGEIRICGITGTIVAKEVRAKDGYLLDDTPQTVKVNPEDTQTLTFYNEPLGGLQIIKKDEETGDRLGGVQFEVRKMNGKIVGTYTTDRYGVIRLPDLEDGWYTVTELRAKDGYLLDDTPQQVEVKNGHTATLELTNRKESNILVHKVDAATGEGLYGAVFVLYDRNHRPIGQYTSDQDGYVYIEDGLEDGKYYIREMEAPDGYLRDEELKTFYVEYGRVSEIRWENTAEKGQIQIVKKSADDNPINGLPAGTLLEGAVFEIYDKAGNKVDTIVSGKDGRAVSKQLPLSRYTVREVQAPDYYSINPTEMTAYLEYPGQIVEFEVRDTSVGTGVSIQKSGPKEAMSNQPVKYTFTGIGNTSTVPLDSFYWRDTFPAWQVRLQQIVTGTYNQALTYKVVYKTNLSGDTYRVLADNLSTQKNYALDASPAALNLAANERVTEFMFVFGTVKGGFAQVEAPVICGTTLQNLANGSSFTNVADVGGLYNGQWIMAVTRWVTKVYAYETIIPQLPQTGF